MSDFQHKPRGSGDLGRFDAGNFELEVFGRSGYFAGVMDFGRDSQNTMKITNSIPAVPPFAVLASLGSMTSRDYFLSPGPPLFGMGSHEPPKYRPGGIFHPYPIPSVFDPVTRGYRPVNSDRAMPKNEMHAPTTKRPGQRLLVVRPIDQFPAHGHGLEDSTGVTPRTHHSINSGLCRRLQPGGDILTDQGMSSGAGRGSTGFGNLTFQKNLPQNGAISIPGLFGGDQGGFLDPGVSASPGIPLALLVSISGWSRKEKKEEGFSES